MKDLISSNKKSEGKILLPILIILFLLIIIGSLGEPIENDTLESNEKELISGENKEGITKDENLEEYIISGESIEKINQTEEKENDNVEVENDDNTGKTNIDEEIIIQIENEETKKEEIINLENIKEEELDKILAYSNSPYAVINNNKPFFYETDLVTTSYEKYGNLDSLRKMYLYNCLYW